MKWHNVPSQGGMVESQDDLEFKNLGILSSISREHPQNSRDNVLDDGAPVEIEYRLVDNVFDSCKDFILEELVRRAFEREAP